MSRSRILIVDDAPENVLVLGHALEAHYDVQFAVSGYEALALIDRQPPDLILLDVVMPIMDGIEVLRRLRSQEKTQDIPVVLISADTSEQTQVDGLDTGADEYLTKPVATSVLLARVRNLLQRKDAENQLRLAGKVFQCSGEAIMVTDRDNKIVDVNPAFTRTTGYTPEEVLGKNPNILASGRTTAAEYRSMWRAVREKGLWQGEIWDRHKNGDLYPKFLTISVVYSKSQEPEHHIAIFTDISERKAAQARIEHLAHHDPLTDLPNRLLLRLTLEHLLSQQQRKNSCFALMLIDLDRFKEINDSLGHPVGDALLSEVARRLTQSVREADTVARLGGDEFVVVLDGATAQEAARVAGQLIDCLGQAYTIKDHLLRTTASIGICLCPEDCTTYEDLMKNADLALYDAKAQGRNNFQFFKHQLNDITRERRHIESRLYLALERKSLRLHYQPQVSASTGKIIGVEALLRWQDEELGWVAPDKFIPIAEETGLILPLGEWVLEQACYQLRLWRDKGILDVQMAVNLSLYQIRQEGLVKWVTETLSRHRLTGADLELELTESAAMKNPQATIQVLHDLRAVGVSLAVDDFGTGYSSLAYLKLLPVQRIKLDKSFVQDIEQDANDAAICSASIAMAHAMGLEVVAEGVETQAQEAYLRALNCDVMQGYFFSRPVPPEQLFQ